MGRWPCERFRKAEQALKHFEAIKAKQLELDSIKETP